MLLRSLRSSSSMTPLYAPETEAGTEGAEGTETLGGRVPLNELPADGPGSGRSKLRKDLEKNFDTDRKTRAREDVSEKQVRKTKVAVNHQEVEEEPEAEGGDEPAVEGQEAAAAAGAEAGAEGEEGAAVAAWTPPEGWTKEAKAEAGKVPAVVQAAITKRETDMAKGVAEIKQRYNEIDQALQPHIEQIRRHGHTPGQAVNQLFSWFEALQNSPDQAFPALMQSFRYDPKRLLGQQKEPAAEANVEQPAGDVPPAVQEYITKLEQRQAAMEQAITNKFGALENTFAEQSYAKTNDILRNWSKDKPHFEDVRGAMAHFIGSGLVPPLEDGSADLDKAYDMALYAMPEVRTKVLADQAAKAAADRKAKADTEKKVQQAAADKARRAGLSIQGGAPGAAVASQGKAKSKSKSVRESIEEARQELAE